MLNLKGEKNENRNEKKTAAILVGVLTVTALAGCGHKLIKTGQDTSAFALQRLREYYSYLPMVYPQIKLIAYFDWYVNAEEEKSDYRLTTNSALQNEYLKLTNGERFIHNGYNGDIGFCYRKVMEGISVDSVFPVSCYAHKYNTEIKTVTYFIDGNYVGMSNEIPYMTYIDASGYQGRHSLKAINCYHKYMRNVKNEEGVWEQVAAFNFEDPEPFGHGEKSVFLISKGGADIFLDCFMLLIQDYVRTPHPKT